MKCILSVKKDSYMEEVFEEYLKKKVFVEEDYMLLYKTPLHKKSSETSNNLSQLPSLMFISKKNYYIFWVECKFRPNLNLNGKLEVLDYYKINRNQNLIEPVLYVIGFEGKPSKPNELFLVPQKDIHPSLRLEHARKFLLAK